MLLVAFTTAAVLSAVSNTAPTVETPKEAPPRFVERIGRWFPVAAERRKEIGIVVLDCDRSPDGALDRCQVASESRKRLNYREAALRMASVRAMTAEPPPGGVPDRVRVTVHFLWPRIW